MRTTFIKTVTELAVRDPDIVVMTGDLGFKIFDELRERIGPRFINAGVAEANMVGTAAGLALSGKRVYCYSIDPFISMRPFEQIRVDVCSHNLPVRLVGIGAALGYAMEGATHHALEDIAVLRGLPNMTVVAPGDKREVEAAIRASADFPTPLYLRLAKDSKDVVHDSVPSFSFGKALEIPPSPSVPADVFLLSSGPMLTSCVELRRRLGESGWTVALFSVPTVKPLDGELMRNIAATAGAVFTIEEHSVIGGLGSAVSEALLELGYKGLFNRFGLPDAFFQIVGGRDYLLRHVGLDVDSLERRTKELLAGRPVAARTIETGPEPSAAASPSRAHRASTRGSGLRES